MSTFACRRCGSCCRVEGYVRLTSGEVGDLANALGLSAHDFTRQYTRLTDDRGGLSLTEKRDGSCVFLGRDGCEVQKVKPRQCRGFPVEWSFEGYERVCACMKEGIGTAGVGGHES